MRSSSLPPPLRGQRQLIASCAGALLACALTVSGFSAPTKKPAQTQAAGKKAPELVLQLGHHFPSSKLVFSPDRKTLISTNGPVIHLWDLPSGLISRRLESPLGWPTAIAMTPDGRGLAAAYRSQVVFWDVRTGAQGGMLRVPDGDVRGLAFSADGRRLCTATASGVVHEWNPRSRALLGKYAGASGRAEHPAYSPDGKWLALVRSGRASAEPAIEVWSTTKRTRLWGALPGEQVRDLSYSPDGKRLAVATGKTVILESQTGKVLSRPEVAGYSGTLSFHPDGERLARTAGDSIQILDTRTWQVVSRRREVSPYEVRWSPDGELLASVGLWKVIHLHRLDGDEAPVRLGRTRQGIRILPSSDGRLLSFMVGTKLCVFDCLTGTLRPDLPNNPGVVAAGFVPGSHTLIGTVPSWIADSRGNPRQAHHRLWNLDEGTFQGEFPPPAPRGVYGSPEWVVGSPDGRLIATGSAIGQLLLWDARTLKQVGAIDVPDHRVFSPVFAGSRFFAAVDPDARGFSLWDVESGKRLWSKKTENEGHFLRLAACRSGDLLAVQALTGAPLAFVTEGPVHLYRLPQGTLVGTIPSPGRKLGVLKFSPDGSLLAAGDSTGRIRWWTVADQRLRGEPMGHSDSVVDLAFTPAGDLVSTGMEGISRLWDTRTGEWRLTWVFELDPELKPGPAVPITLGGWLVMTADGHYTTHGVADRLITWRSNDRVFPASQFEGRFRKPERVQFILSQSWPARATVQP